MRRRVDLQMARIEADVLAKSYGLRKPRASSTCWMSPASPRSRREEPARRTRERGFEVELQIPLFDFGEVNVRQAEQTYMQAVNRLTAKAVNVRSEARDAYRPIARAYDIARHYRREVLPLRKIISDETLLRYNAMQIDVFALLTEARQRIAATTAAIEAQRDFWLAETDLGAAVLGGGGGRIVLKRNACDTGGGKPRRSLKRESTMKLSRRNFVGAAAALAGAAAVTGRAQAASHPGSARSAPRPTMQPPLAPPERPGLSAGGDAQRLDAAVAHEGRLEGIPSRRRAGGARDRARHEGASLGLQRRVARPDHRGGRRRQGAHLRHQQAARAHHRALARHAAAERHGRRRRTDAAAHQAGQDLRLRVRAEEKRHLHVPPARRRDGADGDGHDGLLRRASARSEASCASIATSSSCMQSYDIDPGSYMPKVMTMTDFNLWAWNSRVFPGIDPLVVRKGDRVRVRIGNLTMTNHPIHMHGYHFARDLHGRRLDAGERALAGGHDRRAGRRDARLRVRRRRARRLGDPLPQVASHHERDGPRGEDLHRRRTRRTSPRTIRKLVPDYMPMGAAGMAEMGEMEMPMPDNTLPMMTGFGQFGPMEMGGMFSVVKVREGIARDDYKDPGPYKHPEGTVAYEVASVAGRAGHAQARQAEPHARRRIQRRQAGQQAATQASTLKQENDMKTHRFLSPSPLRSAALGRGRAGRAPARGHAHFSAGEPGDPKKPARVVEVTMQEGDGKMEYVPRPGRGEARRANPVRPEQCGELAHEFVLATTAENLKHAELMKKYPDMEHDDPNGKTLQPKANRRNRLALHQGGRVRIRLPDSRAIARRA